MGDLYVEYEYVITFVQLAMAMFAMGATLHLRDFRAVIVLPRSFLTGLGAQMVLVPLLAYALLRLFDLDPGVAIGLAIIAAVPGGTVSNVFTYAGKGDVALSIALTAVTSLACVVTVPFVLEWLVGSYVAPSFGLPRGRIAAEIVLTLLVPLAIGMGVLRRWPERAAQTVAAGPGSHGDPHWCHRGRVSHRGTARRGSDGFGQPRGGRRIRASPCRGRYRNHGCHSSTLAGRDGHHH